MGLIQFSAGCADAANKARHAFHTHHGQEQGRATRDDRESFLTDSCFAARLARHMALSPQERAALARLEENPRLVRRGQIIQREQDPVRELFVLSRGRVMSFVMLPDGQRQILRIYVAGDFIGAVSTVFGRAQESLVAITDVEICPFDKPALRALIDNHPRVAALMLMISQMDRVALTDRLASLGRAPAKARVAAFLLDMIDRLRMMEREVTNSFALRMTQEDVGDALGLTAVHVNRMLRQLENEGLIARDSGTITLLDEPKLKALSHYVNRYEAVDLDWLSA